MSPDRSEALRLVEDSPFFDADWYKLTYPDVALTGIDPAEHFLRIGWHIGRDPGPDFSTRSYLDEHPELLESRTCPLVVLARAEAPEQSAGTDPGTGPTPGQLKDMEIVRQSRNFDAEWYLRMYPQAAQDPFGAAGHYIMTGTSELLNPGPGFSTRFYLQKHPDIRKAGINPLVHYEQWGRSEGRVILPATLDCAATDPALRASVRPSRATPWSDPDAALDHLQRMLTVSVSGEPVRMYQHFDVAGAERFVAAAECLAAGEDPHDTLVSVIMPAYNRGTQVGAAIDSVLCQSWANLELLVIDDGSTDNTPEVLAGYDDPRVRVLHSHRAGVSGARNAGLAEARGEIIFYLDSDNVWTRDFIWLMMQAMRHSGAKCGYAGTRLQSPREFLIGYRGEPYDWEACLALNYVDMNVFCHHRDFIDRHGMFDTGLKRMVDWDLILRYTREERVFYAPFIGCVYFEDSADMGRITTSQPIVSRKLVHARNVRNCDLHDAVLDLKYNIAIKMFAPWPDREAWGDFHYAESLAEALRRQGHSVRIDFRGDWYKHPVSTDDVAIVLRGLEGYKPRPTQLNIFWGISHPDTVTPEEYDGYQGIFVASRSYAELLGALLSRDVRTLWQCTDTTRFFPPEAGEGGKVDPARGIFIGNSRREYRQIVKWAVEADLPLDVIGQDWESYLPETSILAINAPNTELASYYGGAAFVLNDHWESMRDFGYVSNRVFDVLAAGGQLISDRLPSIEALFGDAVVSVDSADALREAVGDGAMQRSGSERRALAEAVQDAHSFDRRATSLINWIRTNMVPKALVSDELDAVAPDRDAAPRVFWPQRVHVGVLASWDRPEDPGMTRTFERVVAPLTVDSVATKFRLVRLGSAEDCAGEDLDAIVVAAGAEVPDDAVLAAIETRLDGGLPVFLDVSGAPGASGWSRIAGRCSAIWCSDEQTRRAWEPVAGGAADRVPARLDPRIWRRYRNPRPIESGPGGPLRVMAIVRPGSDAGSVLALADRVSAGAAEHVALEIVGLDPDTQPPRAGVTITPWPEHGASYIRRARWLLDNAEADFGIVAAGEGDHGLLEVMALGMVPLLMPGAAPGLAGDPALSSLITRCETEAGILVELLQLADTAEGLLERRRAVFDRVWQDFSTLRTPDPRLGTLLAAGQTSEKQVS